jgi:hypothetical protein
LAIADTARLIAALELQDKFTGPARKAEASLDRLDKKTVTLGQAGVSAGRGIGSLAQGLAGIAAGIGAYRLIKNTITAASDLNEETSKSAVVFGKSAAAVQKFADSAASIGLAKSEALGAAGAFGNMFNTIGLAQKESADMSVTMVQLASDMASFNNEDPSEMLLKLRSGLAGEAEPLRRYGVLLSEAAVKQFAYNSGLAKTGTALTEAQKVQARYGLILKQTNIQQGDFLRTSTGLANQQRILKANFANVSATLGTALLPSLSKTVIKLNEFLIANQASVGNFAEKLPAVFDKLMSIVDRIPFGAIGESFKLMAFGANALLDAFVALPPWVQTAVLTGWGLNKLTGGGLGSIAGQIVGAGAKALLQKIGLMTIQAGVVNVSGGVGGGPATGTVTKTGGGLLGKIGTVALVAGDVALVAEVVKLSGDLVNQITAGNKQLIETATRNAGATAESIKAEMAKIQKTIDENNINPAFLLTAGIGLEESLRLLREQLVTMQAQEAGIAALHASERADNAALLSAIDRSATITEQIGEHTRSEREENNAALNSLSASIQKFADFSRPLPVNLPTSGAHHGREPVVLDGGFVDKVTLDPSQVIDLRNATTGVGYKLFKPLLDAVRIHQRVLLTQERMAQLALTGLSKADRQIAEISALTASERRDSAATQGRLSSLVQGWQAIHTAQGAQTGLLGGILAKPWINNNVVNTNVQVNSNISVDTLTRTFISSQWAVYGTSPNSKL